MLHCRSLFTRHSVSSVCPAVSMKANGFHIVAVSRGNGLTSALFSNIALVSAVCPFRLPEQAGLFISSRHCIWTMTVWVGSVRTQQQHLLHFSCALCLIGVVRYVYPVTACNTTANRKSWKRFVKAKWAVSHCCPAACSSEWMSTLVSFIWFTCFGFYPSVSFPNTNKRLLSVDSFNNGWKLADKCLTLDFYFIICHFVRGWVFRGKLFLLQETTRPGKFYNRK